MGLRADSRHSKDNNETIGKNIAGSAKVGEDVWIGQGVSISNGVTIGNRAKLLLNAVVAYDVGDDEAVSGFYAMPHQQWKKAWTKWKEQKS